MRKEDMEEEKNMEGEEGRSRARGGGRKWRSGEGGGNGTNKENLVREKI